jgi:hypothetical protein
MFIFVDVGSGTCISAYTLFVFKVGVAVAQFFYVLYEILGCDCYAVLLTNSSSQIHCHRSLQLQ